MFSFSWIIRLELRGDARFSCDIIYTTPLARYRETLLGLLTDLVELYRIITVNPCNIVYFISKLGNLTSFSDLSK